MSYALALHQIDSIELMSNLGAVPATSTFSIEHASKTRRRRYLAFEFSDQSLPKLTLATSFANHCRFPWKSICCIYAIAAYEQDIFSWQRLNAFIAILP